MKRYFAIPTLLAFVLLVAVSGGLAGCRPPQGGNGGKGEQAKDVKKEKVVLAPVLVDVAERGEIRSTVSTTGVILPTSSQVLRTEEPGVLHFAKDWKEGDRVEKGEVIASLESEDLQTELAVNKADVAIQQETMDIGQKSLDARLREYRTLQDLYSRGIAAQKDVDAVRLELERAVNSQRQNQINLLKAQSRVRQTERRMDRLEIKAPYGGLLVTRSTIQGQGKFTRGFGEESLTDYDGRQVAANFEVCGVVDISEVYMRCDVTSKDVGRIHADQPSDVTIYARDDIARSGEVAQISNSVDPETRAVQVDIRLDNPEGDLKPGMFGKAEVVTERRRDTIVLPKSVVTRRNNADVVFLVQKMPDTEYEVAKMVSVELGLEGKDDIEVTFGVQSGDRVIIRGFEVLQDSAPINAVDVNAATEE